MKVNVADEIDELTETLLVEPGPGVNLWQDSFKRRIVALDPGHGIIDDLPYSRLLRLRLQVPPARLPRHPENVQRTILVRVFGVGPLRLLRF